jgi:hypothetical protein
MSTLTGTATIACTGNMPGPLNLSCFIFVDASQEEPLLFGAHHTSACAFLFLFCLSCDVPQLTKAILVVLSAAPPKKAQRFSRQLVVVFSLVTLEKGSQNA